MWLKYLREHNGLSSKLMTSTTPSLPASPTPTPTRVDRLLYMLRRWQPWLLGGLMLVIGALLFEALRSLFAELNYDDVVNAVRTTPAPALALAVFATALSYVALTGYDHSALRFVGAAVPYRIVAGTSFIAYALANTIGLGMLTGAAVRMRLYGAVGVEAGLVSRAIAFNAFMFFFGITVVGAAAVFWGAADIAPVMNLPAQGLRIIVGVTLGAALLFALLCRGGGERRLFGRFTLRVPTASMIAGQLVISALDIAAAGAVLWLLLPPGAIGFSTFLGFYAIAMVLGIISHVPGGLGVFEAVMLALLGNHVLPESLAAALVLYRLIYYVLPLLTALALLVVSELRLGTAAPVTKAAASLAPLLLAAYTLVVAIVLLVSGVTPATEEATELLALNVPLLVVEASHFLGSVAGLALLFVARGMLLRLDAAWWAGLALAAANLVACLPKGISLSEAALLSFLVIALALSRRQFTRKSSLLAQVFTSGWLLAMAAILAAITGLLFFAYREVDYSHELWWQFAFNGHASRSLRALVAVALICLGLALYQLLRPRQAKLTLPDEAAIDRAATIAREQDHADAGLVAMGDKHLLMSDSGQAFVMFGCRGRSWVALFDPIGPRQEWPELVWRFLELARESGCRAAFYQVQPQHLPIYLDAGLHVFKLGEFASVSLPDFTLKGSSRANLRQGVSRAERDGLSFEMIATQEVPPLLPMLEAISNAWLGKHHTAEKGFSLGAFNAAYVSRNPVALIRKGQQVVAFATLLTTEGKVEASVDLMRQLPDAPRSSMDYLFTQLMLHFQAQGFQRFGLGMVPLAGMAKHRLAPKWHRLARLMFAHGEHFYNFQGLRAFKEKFDPVWEPRYLAAPGGIAPLLVLADTAALVSGSYKGVLAK